MGYIWLTVSVAALVVAMLLWKAGMLRVGQPPDKLRKLPRFLLKCISNPIVLSAVIIFIVVGVTGSFALSMLPLSYMLPLATAIPIVLIPIFSLYLFKEKVSRMNWLGIAIICVGVIVFGVFQTGVNPVNP